MSNNTITNTGYFLCEPIEVKAVLYLWCGAGYALDAFYVSTDDLEEAMEDVLVYCMEKGLTGFYKSDDDVDVYTYIDPSMRFHGASPAYLMTMDMKFERN